MYGCTLAALEYAAESLNISVHAITSIHSHPHNTRGQRLLTPRKATKVHRARLHPRHGGTRSRKSQYISSCIHEHPLPPSRHEMLLTLRKATTVHPRCTVHRCTLTACGTRRKFLEALTGQSPSTALSRVCEERLLPQAENWPGTPGWGPITALSLPPQPMGMHGGGPMGARALVETL